MKNIDLQYEARIQELIESKGFEELTNKEKEYVLQHISELDYNQRREIIQLTQEDASHIEPAPLFLNEKKSKTGIPLYQAIIGMTAAALIAWIIKPTDGMNFNYSINESAPVIAQVDTVYETIKEYDTVYETKEVPVYITKYKSNPESNNSASSFVADNKTPLKAPKVVNVPNINLNEIASNYNPSSSQDAALIPRMILSD